MFPGESRQGSLLTPNASGPVPTRTGKLLAKVLGQVIQGDASAKRRFPVNISSLNDRETKGARNRQGNASNLHDITGHLSRSLRDEVSIAATSRVTW